MHYWVNCRDPKSGDVRRIDDYMLDGLVPDHVIEAMRDSVADDLGLCRICESGGRRCHVMRWIGRNKWDKFCPVLWHDVFKPLSWRVEELA